MGIGFAEDLLVCVALGVDMVSTTHLTCIPRLILI